MSYSVKTNALPWLLHYLKEKGFYAEVVSEMEYDLVRRLGFPGKHMIYNGPIKDKKTWEAVLLAGGLVNMDSTYELDWIKEISSLYPDRQFSVGLRVNCDIAVMCPQEELAEEDGGRFGYCYENWSSRGPAKGLTFSQCHDRRASSSFFHKIKICRGIWCACCHGLQTGKGVFSFPFLCGYGRRLLWRKG